METYWDAFINEFGVELSNMPLSEILEKFYYWLPKKKGGGK
jgi:hypothetical protein